MLKTTNSSNILVKDTHLVYLDTVFVLTAVKFVRKLLMDKLMTQNGLVIGKAPIKKAHFRQNCSTFFKHLFKRKCKKLGIDIKQLSHVVHMSQFDVKITGNDQLHANHNRINALQ